MRKRNIDHLSDTIFWYIIYMLPVLSYLILIASRHGAEVPSLSQYFTDFGIPFVSDLIGNALVNIFGADGILPLYGASVGIPIFSWYVSMLIIHLAVDVLLFIPRMAHKWMDDFFK